jgi:hypothetical protein
LDGEIRDGTRGKIGLCPNGLLLLETSDQHNHDPKKTEKQGSAWPCSVKPFSPKITVVIITTMITITMIITLIIMMKTIKTIINNN